jgi:hypothetical protein
MGYFYVRDGDMVYRDSKLGGGYDVYMDGKWVRASGELCPSEQDLDRSRVISQCEAETIIIAAKSAQ